MQILCAKTVLYIKILNKFPNVECELDKARGKGSHTLLKISRAKPITISKNIKNGHFLKTVTERVELVLNRMLKDNHALMLESKIEDIELEEKKIQAEKQNIETELPTIDLKLNELVAIHRKKKNKLEKRIKQLNVERQIQLKLFCTIIDQKWKQLFDYFTKIKERIIFQEKLNQHYDRITKLRANDDGSNTEEWKQLEQANIELYHEYLTFDEVDDIVTLEQFSKYQKSFYEQVYTNTKYNFPIKLNIGNLKNHPIIEYMKNYQNKIDNWIKNHVQVSKYPALNQYNIEYICARYKYFMLKSDKLWSMAALVSVGLPITTKNMVKIASLSTRARAYCTYDANATGTMRNDCDIIELIEMAEISVTGDGFDLQMNLKEEKSVWKEIIRLNKNDNNGTDPDPYKNTDLDAIDDDDSHVDNEDDIWINTVCNRCFFETKNLVQSYTKSITKDQVLKNIQAYFGSDMKITC